MLTKDLLRVSRRGGGFHPQFVGDDEDAHELAARILGTYQGHVGEPKDDLDDALTALEREADDFKLVRGFAKLLERDAEFETATPLDPERVRRTTFAASEEVGVVTSEERATALSRAADRLDSTPDAVERSLYGDLAERQLLASFEPRWDPEGLVAQYDLSLAQTALFDATELRARSSDPKRLISAVKRLGLLYEIRQSPAADGDDDDTALSNREVVVTGPTTLFRSTRRYGTRFARLLRTLVKSAEWTLTATIDDRGTERELSLSDADPIRAPGAEPVAEVSYDSGVEADFAARFEALDLDWTLVREPEPLATGTRAMIPDFAFDYHHADFRVYFEIMGFWTPEYVEKKLSQLAELEEVELLVAVDRNLGVGEEIAARDHRAIPYSGTVRLKDVRNALRRYEDELVAVAASELPDELAPDDDVISLAELAERYGVSEDAIEGAAFPDHERVGRTLVRPAVLARLDEEIESGMALSEVEPILHEHGIDDSGGALSALGYRVEWEGLGGGTVRERDE